MEETLVPIIAIIVTFGAPAAVLWEMIALRHEERQAIIERGLDPAAYKLLYARNPIINSPLRALRWGLFLMCGGGGLWLGSWLVQVFQFPENTIYGVTLLSGGIGLVLYYFISKKDAARASDDGKK